MRLPPGPRSCSRGSTSVETSSSGSPRRTTSTETRRSTSSRSSPSSPARSRPSSHVRGRWPMRPAEELRDLVETFLRSLAFESELGGLEEALRYSLESGGKRVRPVLCLAVAEANGASAEEALPAATALELVHTFSLVHDDLPAMDDDDERRGRPSTHVAFGDGVALLAGDALLAEALRLALTYESEVVARDLVDATLGMIGGQYRDITGDDGNL